DCAQALIQSKEEPFRVLGTLSNDLLNLYVEGHIGIRLNLVAGAVWNDLEPGYFCVTFDKYVGAEILEEDAESGFGRVDLGSGFGNVGTHDIQLTVPIPTGEVIEPEKHGSLGAVLSVVRLYRFEELPVLI